MKKIFILAILIFNIVSLTAFASEKYQGKIESLQGDIDSLLQQRKDLKNMAQQAKSSNDIGGEQLIKQQMAEVQDRITKILKSLKSSDFAIDTDSIDNDVIAQSETIDSLLNQIKLEPSEEKLYKQIEILYEKNKESGFKVFSDGKLIDFSLNGNIQPLISENRTLIPLRAVAESFGANVSWNSESGLISISLNEKEIKLKINSKEAFVNDKMVSLEVPATSIEGRTVVPLRFIGEAFGKKVGWFPAGELKIISISQ